MSCLSESKVTRDKISISRLVMRQDVVFGKAIVRERASVYIMNKNMFLEYQQRYKFRPSQWLNHCLLLVTEWRNNLTSKIKFACNLTNNKTYVCIYEHTYTQHYCISDHWKLKSNNAGKQPVFKELHATTKWKKNYKVLILELLILYWFSCNNGIFTSKFLSSDYYSKESGMQHMTLQHIWPSRQSISYSVPQWPCTVRQLFKLY